MAAKISKTTRRKFKKTIEKGSRSVLIKYKINGFWKDGYISVYQFRNIGNELWEKPYISRRASCNGNDYDHESDYEYENELNVAAAINDAVKECRRLDKRTGKN